MTILPKVLMVVTLAGALLGCGHALVPLQHRGNDAISVVYYDAKAQAFDICSRVENTRQFKCAVTELD